MTATPTLAELQSVCQPRDLMGRVNGEHWAGRLYMRRFSLRVTRVLLRTRISADAVTWMMIAAGVLAALVLTVPHPLTPVAAFVLIQGQLLADCVDGEIARWRGTCTPAGIYLDRIGHYTTDAALVIALGVRVDGGLTSIDGWTTLGLLVAVLVLVLKSESHLVEVARAHAGRATVAAPVEASVPRSGALRRARRVAGLVPFFRAFLAVEMSLLALAAAIVDAVVGGLTGTRALLLALVPVAAVTVAGHLLAILVSKRLE